MPSCIFVSIDSANPDEYIKIKKRAGMRAERIITLAGEEWVFPATESRELSKLKRFNLPSVSHKPEEHEEQVDEVEIKGQCPSDSFFSVFFSTFIAENIHLFNLLCVVGG